MTSAPKDLVESVRSQGNSILLELGNQIKNLKLTKQNEDGIRNPTVLGHSLLAGSLLLVIVVTSSVLTNFADSRVRDWMAPLHENSKQQPLPAQPDQQLSKEEQALIARLHDQLKMIRARSEAHREVMFYFYKQYFVSMSMATGLALVASVCLFFISQSGWKAINNALFNIFLVTSSMALLYRQLPQMFEQEANLDANRALHLQYVALENEVRSYLVTRTFDPIPEGRNSTDGLRELSEFIHSTDRQLTKLNQIPIEFSIDKTLQIPDFRRPDYGSDTTSPPAPAADSSPSPSASPQPE